MSLEQGVICEQVSPEAIYHIDTRQYETTMYHYDERVANALLGGKHYQETGIPFRPGSDRSREGVS